MNYTLRGLLVVGTVGVVSLVGLVPLVQDARGSGGEASRIPALANKAWQSECGSCHVAFPPSLLPKGSWKMLMSSLDRHFGENATLDEATAAEILGFLETNAADSGGSRLGAKVMSRIPSGELPLRITETAWFKREHREVPAAAWQRKAVGSPANCAACHKGAEKGLFDEYDIRIPK